MKEIFFPLTAAAQRQLHPTHPARRAGRTLDRGTTIPGVLTNFHLEEEVKECTALLFPNAAA